MPARPKSASPTPVTDAYRARGDWNPLWDELRALDPAFMEAYLAFRDVPHRHGPLPAHFKELILVAINAATTHMYGPGVRRHIRNALRAGATPQEILETIELTTVMGIHSCNLAIPILAEEIARAGIARAAGGAEAGDAAAGDAAGDVDAAVNGDSTFRRGARANGVPARRGRRG